MTRLSGVYNVKNKFLMNYNNNIITSQWQIMKILSQMMDWLSWYFFSRFVGDFKSRKTLQLLLVSVFIYNSA